MENKKSVTFNEVKSVFEKEHDTKNGTNEWAWGALTAANKKCDGRWSSVSLDIDEVLSIVFPYHTDGELELVPVTGLTLKKTVDRLNLEKDYPRKNPGCWKKLEFLKDKPFNPIFLSMSIIDYDVYPKITEKGSFIHLDGLHRLISWSREGRIKDAVIDAYIAGEIK